MKFGKLDFEPVEENLPLVGEPVQQFIEANDLEGVLVSEIDPDVSDTAAFCEKYNVGMDVSVNCVIVQARRGDKTWYAACMIPATERIDVNGVVRRQLDARKISFAPKDVAVELTQMEFGGICPIGLPSDWPILVDTNAAKLDYAIIGSGVRKSKLLVSGELLASLFNATVLELSS